MIVSNLNTFPLPKKVSSKLINWILFISLCMIWGSSFMLMKWGLFDANQNPILSPYQVAAIRILSSGLIMLPFIKKAWQEIPKKTIPYIILSGWLGSFFPAFLFCIAETKVDGALSGSLNSLTPIFVIIIGALFYKRVTSTQKIIGVIIGLIGCGMLTYTNNHQPLLYFAYIGLIILATIFYGINVNMVQKELQNIPSISIAALAFVSLIPPSFLILYTTGFFNLPLHSSAYISSTLASCLLGVLGTAFASVLFYMLVKKAGGLFASLVTYGIPFVAIAWGIYFGEHVTPLHICSLIVILFGVFFANNRS
jgi:drug/metabolite transporter (DMT)-like permease